MLHEPSVNACVYFELELWSIYPLQSIVLTPEPKDSFTRPGNIDESGHTYSYNSVLLILRSPGHLIRSRDPKDSLTCPVQVKHMKTYQFVHYHTMYTVLLALPPTGLSICSLEPKDFPTRPGKA